MAHAFPPGVRVSVRRRLPEGGYGDVLGHVVRWDDHIEIERRDGSIVSVDPTTVVAAKEIPPPPVRRS